MCTAASHSCEKPVNTVQSYIPKIIVQAKLKQFITGLCNRPAIGGMMFNLKSTGLRCIAEIFVVVGVAPAAILDSMKIIIVMHHLM